MQEKHYDDQTVQLYIKYYYTHIRDLIRTLN